MFEQVVGDGAGGVGVSLEVLDIATPGVTRTIVPAKRMANNSDWSPDGGLIAFSAPIKGGEPGGSLSDIWVVHPDGTKPQRVTDVAATGGSAVQPTFTPDGARIMFKLTDDRVGASDAIATIPVGGGSTGTGDRLGLPVRMARTPASNPVTNSSRAASMVRSRLVLPGARRQVCSAVGSGIRRAVGCSAAARAASGPPDRSRSDDAAERV